MKKIGIVTFHRAINYGGILQCYSLQKKIKDMKNDAEVIDYISDDVYKIYKPFYVSKFNIIKTPLKWLLDTIFYKQNKRVKSKFEKFLIENISLSKNINDKQYLQRHCSNYDVIISGSDQVWNKKITLEDYDVYDLSLVNHKQKIAYAASIGNDEIEKDEKKYYNELIDKYKSISVREKSLEKIFNKKITTVLDPVFLSKKEEWERLIDIKKGINEKYIFVFSLQRNKQIDSIINKLSKSSKIYYYSKLPVCKKNVKRVFDLSPNEFLEMIYNAEMVITNSFHCLAFSIIFNKKNIAVLHSDKSSRQTDLLELLGMNDRIYSGNNLDKLIKTKTNYEIVNEKIENLRNESLCFLEESIN